MRNWVLSRISLIIIVVSYLDSILSIISSSSRWTALMISSIIFTIYKSISLFSGKDHKFHFKWSCIDLLTSILFFIRIKDNVSFSLTYSGILSNNASINLSPYFAYAFIFFSTIIIINEIMIENGFGLSKFIRTYFLRIKYAYIYFLLSHMPKPTRSLIKKKYFLTEAESILLCEAAKWKKSKKVKEYPVLLRKDAEKRSFIRNWLYNNSIIFGTNIELSKKSDSSVGTRFTVKVNLTESHLSIVNNSGKHFLRREEKNNVRDSDMKNDNERAHSFLSNGLDAELTTKSIHLDQNCVYRWGSAGVIPIVKWKNRIWVAFVFRDIYPKGWNFPLGGTENELEKGRPSITAIRELLEELIITNNPLREYADGGSVRFSTRRELYHPLLNSISTEINYRASKRIFYKQQEEIINQTCTFRFNDIPDISDTIDCQNCNTTLDIRVSDNNRVNLLPNSLSTNCLIAVNSYEQAIECIKPIYFCLEDENELRMGEIDYIKEQWINNPVILIDYEKLKILFSKIIEYQSHNSEEFGEGMFIEFLNDPHNYHIFGLNLDDRKRHIQYLKEKKIELDSSLISFFHKKERSRIDAQSDYLETFISENEKHFTNENTLNTEVPENNPAFYLCPVSWKSLYYYFSGFYGTDHSVKATGE